MIYNKFYTPLDIANLLIGQLKVEYPKSAVDICCGSHNLLSSAKQRWPNTKYVGVDIIEHYANGVECIKSDGRKFALEHPNKFQLVLANPPFGYVNKKQEYPELMNVIPLNTKLQGLKTKCCWLIYSFSTWVALY